MPEPAERGWGGERSCRGSGDQYLVAGRTQQTSWRGSTWPCQGDGGILQASRAVQIAESVSHLLLLRLETGVASSDLAGVTVRPVQGSHDSGDFCIYCL